MKKQQTVSPKSRLTSDSQSRLFAYAAAAGLGAFFGGQTAEGQVTESRAFASYPVMNASGYLDIDGDGTNDFKLGALSGVWLAIIGTSPGDLAISPSYGGYLIPWTNGVTLNATTATRYGQSFGLLANNYCYFIPDGERGPGPFELGFSFIAGDGKTHFGYMNILVNFVAGGYGSPRGFFPEIYGIYYNKTPNAAIVTGSLPPVIVSATSIQVGAKNAVTINFASSDNAAASAFTLQTSPALGASAKWTTDTQAVISSSGPGVYQAVTTGTGRPAQFFRIKH